MTQPTEPDRYNRLMALLGLTGNTPPTQNPQCPSDQQLSDFIQGQLKAKAYQRILSHLNQCPDCRQVWLDTCNYMETLAEDSLSTGTAPPSMDSVNRAKTVASSWLSRLTPKPVDHAPIWSWATVSMLAAAILLVVLWPLQQRPSSLNPPLDAAYQSLVALDQPAFEQAIAGFTLPWDNAVRGFSQTENSLEAKAFGAGLWVGQRTLLGQVLTPLPERLRPPGQKAWQDSLWEPHYQAGRWLLLLWAQTQTAKTSVDWHHLQQLNQALIDSIDSSDTELKAALHRVDAKLQPLLAGNPSARAHNRLQRLLQQLVQHHAPH